MCRAVHVLLCCYMYPFLAACLEVHLTMTFQLTKRELIPTLFAMDYFRRFIILFKTTLHQRPVKGTRWLFLWLTATFRVKDSFGTKCSVRSARDRGIEGPYRYCSCHRRSHCTSGSDCHRPSFGPPGRLGRCREIGANQGVSRKSGIFCSGLATARNSEGTDTAIPVFDRPQPGVHCPESRVFLGRI